AVGETFELRDAERRPAAQELEQLRAAQARLTRQRGPSAIEAAPPSVRIRECGGRVAVVGREAHERAQPLTLRRRRFEGPRERRQRTARRRARDVVLVEDGGSLLPERARLARRTLVGRRFADEEQTTRRARARGVEEVAVARDLVRALEPPAEAAAAVVVEERRRPRAARERAFLQPEHEEDLEPPR